LLEAPRILFVPVSGAFGMGEYARSLSIARAVQQQWPQAHIHFILSRQAPYAAASPFPSTLLDSSPTFHSAAVAAVIQSFKPHVVIFDNAGRTAQLLAAHRTGARIVFISSRARQRRKAFRWRWMRLIDEHWIAYPQFIAGGFALLERIKLDLLHRPTVRYLDVILSRNGSGGESLTTRVGLKFGSYVLVVPGGGTGHPRAGDATAKFLAAANTLAEAGTLTVFVGPTGTADAGVPNATLSVPNPASGAPAHPLLPCAALRCFNSLPQADLADLMRGARLIVTNGGSTLLQAIACGRACIAIPIAQDQRQRIQRCVAADVAIAAQLDAPSIAQTAGDLLRDESARAAMERRASDLKLADGIEVAKAALSRLLAGF
jgi:spore coat polysaccharide biosynthesis predicted glycosyltransferase SpsG